MARSASILRAHEGEVLDGLIWRGAGLGPESLPAIMAANPGVSKLVTLPAGYAVTIPPITDAPVTRPVVHLWN